MTRGRLLLAGAIVATAALVAWIASNTYWADTVVPTPMKGEARTNPFYAAGQLASRLGASVSNSQRFDAPAADSIIVLSSWHWNLTTQRREAIERWVERGGRLVVDSTLIGSEVRFSRWTGVTRAYPADSERESEETDDAAGDIEDADEDGDLCVVATESIRPSGTTQTARRLRLCNFDDYSFLRSEKAPLWAMDTAAGRQVVRVPIGQGSVTLVNGTPFRYLALLDGEHARLFAAATRFRRGDLITFLSEDEHPTLLTLMWREGAPVVVLSLAVIGLVLWRGAVRFGPRLRSAERSRRSLAEQINGSGQFALRYGGGESLHAAALRALGEAATRRIPGYGTLTSDQRITALERATGVDAQTLAGAMFTGGHRRPHDLKQAIALIESLRRRLLAGKARPTHGTD